VGEPRRSTYRNCSAYGKPVPTRSRPLETRVVLWLAVSCGFGRNAVTAMECRAAAPAPSCGPAGLRSLPELTVKRPYLRDGYTAGRAQSRQPLKDSGSLPCRRRLRMRSRRRELPGRLSEYSGYLARGVAKGNTVEHSCSSSSRKCSTSCSPCSDTIFMTGGQIADRLTEADKANDGNPTRGSFSNSSGGAVWTS
jgi:hypothetical protein